MPKGVIIARKKDPCIKDIDDSQLYLPIHNVEGNRKFINENHYNSVEYTKVILAKKTDDGSVLYAAVIVAPKPLEEFYDKHY